MKTKLCRPVFIPQDKATWPNCLWIGRISKELKLDTSYNDNPCTLDPIDDSMLPQQLILISLENDKIEVGDTFYDRSDNQIVKWNMSYSFPSESYKYCSKVIVLQHQLSIEYIQQFIEEHNEGKINDVEIEMESVGNYRHTEYVHKYYQLKLINGFINITKLSDFEQISIGEETIKLPIQKDNPEDLMFRYSDMLSFGEYCFHKASFGNNTILTFNDTFIEWLNNK